MHSGWKFVFKNIVVECVNHDRPADTSFSPPYSLLGLLAESKSLVHLGVTIPDTARVVLGQEERIKVFKQQLEDVLGEFYSVHDSIDPAVRPLMEGQVESVLR